ncbi:hypothetical protein, partial [Laceyella putida]
PKPWESRSLPGTNNPTSLEVGFSLYTSWFDSMGWPCEKGLSGKRTMDETRQERCSSRFAGAKPTRGAIIGKLNK